MHVVCDEFKRLRGSGMREETSFCFAASEESLRNVARKIYLGLELNAED
jgi:hypothetical protein